MLVEESKFLNQSNLMAEIPETGLDGNYTTSLEEADGVVVDSRKHNSPNRTHRRFLHYEPSFMISPRARWL